MTHLILTPEAREDLQNIAQYTEANYGECQVITYESKISDALDFITQNPDAGTSRDDIPDGYQAYPVEKHWIIYTVQSDTIYISRILHQSVDIDNQPLH